MPKTPYTPEMPIFTDPKMQGLVRAIQRMGLDAARRANSTLAMDGSETMTGPLPLQPLATADFPPAADHEGSFLYDATTKSTYYSNGTSWINTGVTTITYTGDVTGSGSSSGSTALTIANDAVTNAKAANMATQTIKGRTTAGTGDPEDLTAAQAAAVIQASLNPTIAWSGVFKAPEDETVYLVLKAPFAFTITEVTTRTEVGTSTCTFKIDGTSLGGTANSASTSEQSQTHSSSNAVAVGQDLTVVFSSTSSDCENLAITIKATRFL